MVVRRSDDAGLSYPHSLEVYNGGAAYSCLSTMPPKFGGDQRLGYLSLSPSLSLSLSPSLPLSLTHTHTHTHTHTRARTHTAY